MTPYRLPLRLPYDGAATVEDADGATVAECPDHATAAALAKIVNAGLAWWGAAVEAGDAPDSTAAADAAVAAEGRLLLALDVFTASETFL